MKAQQQHAAQEVPIENWLVWFVLTARDPIFPSSAGSISLSFLIPSWVVHPVIDRLVADKF